MSITPINNKNISDEVLEQIKNNILSGDWKSGDKIPGELELCEKLCVSRISIRQAIHRLVGMGILTVRRGEGTYVSEVIPAKYFESLLSMLIMEMPEYMEVQEFRLALEPSTARLAALKATEEDIEKLKISTERLKKLKGDIYAFAKEDINFHMLLANCSHNSLIIKTNTIIVDLMGTAMEKTVKISGFEDGINYHTQIYNCIKNRQAAEAERIMKMHIENNIIELKH